MTRFYTRTREYIAMALLMVFLPGCRGCNNASPKDYFTDAKVVALAKAAQRGDVAEIDRLVAEGVDVNSKGKGGITPLWFPITTSNKKGFRRLLEHGADPNIQDEEGDSVIHLVARAPDDSEWLEMVLEHGGDPNLVDPIDTIDSYKNTTPLFRAIDSRNLRNVKLLVNAGANVDHQNIRLETPAMEATGYRWYRAVYLLLETGSDWRVKNKNGQDLAFFCFMNGPPNKDFREDYEYYFKVLDFLRDKGVNLDAAKQAADKHMGRD